MVRENLIYMIHIVHFGSPLCKFSDEHPIDWQGGHTYVTLDDANQSNCSHCMESMKHLKTDVFTENLNHCSRDFILEQYLLKIRLFTSQKT